MFAIFVQVCRTLNFIPICTIAGTHERSSELFEQSDVSFVATSVFLELKLESFEMSST